MPKFTPWAVFLRDWTWKQGQHVTLVGPNGSGKTTLARQILPRRDFVIVLATKARDSSLYGPLLAQGYHITDELREVNPREHPKIIWRPRLSEPTAAARAAQREAFRELLVMVFSQGGWCLYADEIRYITDTLKLQSEMELLWLQGRSLGITIVASTQRPVSIPIEAFEMAPHLFLWRNSDEYAVRRMAEFMSENSVTLRYSLPRLPWHEVLYAEAQTGRLVRTKVSKP